MSTGVLTSPFLGDSLHLLLVLSKSSFVIYHPKLSGPVERNTEQAVVARLHQPFPLKGTEGEWES